jgi:hypothetical protein
MWDCITEMLLALLAAFQYFNFLQVSDLWDCWYINGEVKDMCLGQRFPNCGLQTPHAHLKYMMRSAKQGGKKKKVCKCWSFFRNILRQVLGFVDVFGLRFVVHMWSDCVANLFVKCEVKVDLVMWVCGR